MKWAKERRGGTIVHATNAKTWGDYRCPTCNAPVFLRSGQYNAEHFAHKARQAKPDCENFHPAFDLSRAPYLPSAPPERKHIDPLQLGIELEPETEKHGGRKWRLCLTVPKAADAHGQIAIDLGGNDRRTISLTKLSLGAETYTVQPDAVEFGASWVSHEVRPEYRDVVQDRIPGLDTAMLNVFAATRSKQKPRIRSLSWGEGYYLVTRSDIPLKLPPSLPNKPLARFRGWDCILTMLPHDPSPDIEAWFQQHGDMPIARSARDWAVIYPAPFALGDEGDLLIHSNEYIVLALKSDGLGAESELSCSTGRSHETLELDGTRSQLIALSGDNRTTESQIHLTWSSAYVATLATAPYPEQAAQISVDVVCDSPEGSARAALHHASSHALLSDVRLDRRSLKALRGHPALHGTLRWRQPKALNWEELPIPFSPTPSATVEDGLLRIVSATIQDRSRDVELSFGPFGVFRASALLTEASTEPFAEKRLPAPLRARIEWLSRTCRSYTDTTRRPISTLNDKSLLAHLKHLNVPTKFLAHKRAIHGQLRQLQFEGW